VTPPAIDRHDRGRGLVGQQPIAKAADGEMRDRCKSPLVMGLDDETRHLVGLVRNDVFVQKCRQRQIGERIVRGDPLLAALRRNAGQLIAAAQRRGLAEQRLEIAEHVAALSDRRAIHGEALIDRLSAASASVARLEPKGPVRSGDDKLRESRGILGP